jgi:hypothetical protein
MRCWAMLLPWQMPWAARRSPRVALSLSGPARGTARSAGSARERPFPQEVKLLHNGTRKPGLAVDGGAAPPLALPSAACRRCGIDG